MFKILPKFFAVRHVWLMKQFSMISSQRYYESVQLVDTVDGSEIPNNPPGMV